VRIALNLKGLKPDEEIDVNLMTGAQREAAYRAVNPMMALPALVDGDGPILIESLAIIEYLDETHPAPPLLPKDARGRARVRGLAQIVACDSHPLIVPRVREYLEHELKIDEPTRVAWCRHWHTRALTALEIHLQGKETAPFPNVVRIAETCQKIDAFARAHPLRQPGAPASA
jgi:maleylacetoacetate isomerase